MHNSFNGVIVYIAKQKQQQQKTTTKNQLQTRFIFKIEVFSNYLTKVNQVNFPDVAILSKNVFLSTVWELYLNCLIYFALMSEIGTLSLLLCGHMNRH